MTTHTIAADTVPDQAVKDYCRVIYREAIRYYDDLQNWANYLDWLEAYQTAKGKT